MEPDDILEQHMRKTADKVDAARESRPGRKGKPASAKQLAALDRGRQARAEKKRQQDLVREKIEKGLPITEEERALAVHRLGRKRSKLEELCAAASGLVITPSTVKALRLVVEQTAAKYKYNPIEELIKLTKGNQIKDAEKAKIHQALMPYLIPQISPTKGDQPEEVPENERPKVVIKQFVIEGAPARPIHETKRDNIQGVVVDGELSEEPQNHQTPEDL